MGTKPTIDTNRAWTPDSWRGPTHDTYQQHTWGDRDKAAAAVKALSERVPLVFAGEAEALTGRLKQVSEGEAFLLHAGDCAESFDTAADSIRDTLKAMLQMALILTFSGGMPIVKVGRVAGQYAKPRSSPVETRGDVTLPSFMGHMINDVGFSPAERVPDPGRMLTAYERSAATLNLIRAFTRGGFAHISRAAQWNREFVRESPAGRRYAHLVDEIDQALRFVEVCGIVNQDAHQLRTVDFYSSHEALVLDYEEALTRQDSITGDWYDCSAHMLWIGTRSLKPCYGGHIEFLRGVRNPLGCKIGVKDEPSRVVDLCEALNPDRRPGRLTLIARMGAGNVRTHLPPIIRAVEQAGHPVVWSCDPMHGNTYTAQSGHKTRDFDTVLAEISEFFEVHADLGTWPGGLHLELTGDMVTECVGGADGLTDADLFTAFETLCDPRLNAAQAIEVAFRAADLLRSGRQRLAE